MQLRAEFLSERNAPDRRRASRRVLQLSVVSTIAKKSQPVLIRSLSRTGMMIETVAELDRGDEFEVLLPESGRTVAKVVWREGALFGCVFEDALPNATVSAAALVAPPDVGPSTHSFSLTPATSAGPMLELAADDVRLHGAIRLLIVGSLSAMLWAAIIAALFAHR
jgi:hypothetical protein